MIREKTQLPIAAVDDRVGVGAGRKEGAGITQIYTLAAGDIFHAKGLVMGIASGREHLKTDYSMIGKRIAVSGGEIAIDAVADFLAHAVNGDRFAHQQRSIILQRDIAVEIEDGLNRHAGLQI